MSESSVNDWMTVQTFCQLHPEMRFESIQYLKRERVVNRCDEFRVFRRIGREFFISESNYARWLNEA